MTGSRPEIVLIAAVSENGVIGRDGDLPWRLPADLERFKRVTLDHTVIMGRRTFDSVGRPLPRRRSIIISRNPDLRIEGAEVVAGVDEALRLAGEDDRVFVLGGGEIYRLLMPRADRLDLTVVHVEVEGDTSFPEVDPDVWRMTSDEPHPADERHACAFSFRSYERANATPRRG